MEQLISDVLAIIRDNDGIKQTELYKRFSSNQKLDIQSLIYMLDSCGKVFRQKEGSTYRLSLIDQSKTIPYVSGGKCEAIKNGLSMEDRKFCDCFLNKIRSKAQGNVLPIYNLSTDLPLHMISPVNKAVAPMIYYPHFPNLNFLKMDEMQYVYLLMYLAGRYPDPNIEGYGMNGVSQAMFPDPKHAINMLWALQFVSDANPESNLICPSPLGYVMLLSLYYDRSEGIEEIEKMQHAVADHLPTLSSVIQTCSNLESSLGG